MRFCLRVWSEHEAIQRVVGIGDEDVLWEFWVGMVLCDIR